MGRHAEARGGACQSRAQMVVVARHTGKANPRLRELGFRLPVRLRSASRVVGARHLRRSRPGRTTNSPR